MYLSFVPFSMVEDILIEPMVEEVKMKSAQSLISGVISQLSHNVLNYANVNPLCEKAGASMPGGMETPWGRAHVQRQLDDGILWIEAGEHGGLLVERAKAEEMLSERALAIGKLWHDFLAFEQEKDMMVFFYEYPELYPWAEEELTVQLAEECVRRDHPDYFTI